MKAKDLKVGDKIKTEDGEVTIKRISRGWLSRPSLFIEWASGWVCLLEGDIVA